MIDWDKTIICGDYVRSNYHKGNYIFKVIDIERRYLNKDDIKSYCYKGCKVGDEYSPLVKIVSVANMTLDSNGKKKRTTNAMLDISWVYKIDKDYVIKHIKHLQNIMDELWP